MSSANFESLAAIELESIHLGLPVLDAMLKEAPVDILTATPIPPGRFIIVITGRVGEIESSYRRGLEAAGPPVDHLFLPEAHIGILPAVESTREEGARAPQTLGPWRARDDADAAVALFETSSICSGLRSSDRVLKDTDAELASLHLARGICGKSFGVVLGRQDMVEAAIEAARTAAERHAAWVGSCVLPRPDPELLRNVLTRPWGFLGGQEIL